MSLGLYMDVELSIGRCIADLEAVAKAALPEDAQGQIIFL
jgi:hypothetical protein